MSLCIAAARDKVIRIKRNTQKGLTVRDACEKEGSSLKEYYADIDYLNRNGFCYAKEVNDE